MIFRASCPSATRAVPLRHCAPPAQRSRNRRAVGGELKPPTDISTLRRVCAAHTHIQIASKQLQTPDPAQRAGSMALSTSRHHRAFSCCSRRSTVRVAAQSQQTPTGQQQQQQQQDLQRRALLGQLLAAGLAVAQPALVPRPAAAEDLGRAAAAGFVGWWKSRRTANGGAKLLAPLYVAQRRLQEASQLLQQATGGAATSASSAPPPDPEALKGVLQLVRSSSLNCYVFEALPDDSIETRASLLTQRYELSDPCTFRIVLKNVTDLEPPETQAAAASKMESLVLSYQKLDALLDMAREGNGDALPKAAAQLDVTAAIAADIEAFVKATLGV